MGCTSSVQMKRHVIEDFPLPDYTPSKIQGDELDRMEEDLQDVLHPQWTIPSHSLEVVEAEGSWKARGGGSRNWGLSFFHNPQYLLDLSHRHDFPTEFLSLQLKEELIDFSVCLTQTCNSKPLHAAFFIFSSEKGEKLNLENCDLSRPDGESGAFVNWKQVRQDFQLPRKSYVIVPATFEPGLMATFTLTVIAPPPVSLTPL